MLGESQAWTVFPGNGTVMRQSFLDLSNLGKNGVPRWLGGTLLILFLWFIVGSFATLPFLFLSGMDLRSGNLSTGDPFWIYIAVSVGFPFIWLGVWQIGRAHV